MPLRVHRLIRIIALGECTFRFQCIMRLPKPRAGAEMAIHALIFGLIAAAILAQKAGGEHDQALISCGQNNNNRTPAYQALQFWMDTAVLATSSISCVSPFR